MDVAAAQLRMLLDFAAEPFGAALELFSSASVSVSAYLNILDHKAAAIYVVAFALSLGIARSVQVRDVFAAIGSFLGAESEKQDKIAALLICHLSLVIYAWAYWSCRPIRPYLTQELGVDRITLGFMDSLFSAAQIASSLFFGYLLDRRGPRDALIVAHTGTALVYFGLFASTIAPASLQVHLLFASQVPGVFMSVMLCSQAAVAFFASEAERAKAMGRLSLSYGVGMVTGSWMGGSLAEATSYSHVALLSACTTWAFSFFVLLPFLPAIKSAKADRKAKSKKARDNLFSAALAIFKRSPQYARLVATTCIFGMGASLHRSTFNVALPDHFKLSAAEAGKLTSFGAVVSMIANVAIVGSIVKNSGERKVIFIAMSLSCLGYLMYSVATDLAHVTFLLVPMGLASTVLYTVITSQMTSLVNNDEMGLAVSMRHAIGSITGLIAPPLGAFLMQEVGFESIGLICAACTTGALLCYLPSIASKKK